MDILNENNEPLENVVSPSLKIFIKMFWREVLIIWLLIVLVVPAVIFFNKIVGIIKKIENKSQKFNVKKYTGKYTKENGVYIEDVYIKNKMATYLFCSMLLATPINIFFWILISTLWR